MKKIFLISILSLSLILTYGCGKKSLVKKDQTDKNLKDTIETDNPKVDKEYKEDKEDKEDKGNINNKNDIEGSESMDKSNEDIIYVDNQYNFSLRLPSSWKNDYTVEKGRWIDDLDDSIDFNFEIDNTVSNIFTIVVIDDSSSSGNFDNPFLTYMGENDGKTFLYISAMEPSEDLLLEGNEEKLEIMTIMVGDVEEIIDSFEFRK